MILAYEGLPPSKNHAKERYGIGYSMTGKRYTKERYRKHVTEFLESFPLLVKYHAENLELFLQRYESGKPCDVIVSVTYSTDNQRCDRQNYTQFLSDALQDFLGINDRWFVWRDNPLKFALDPMTEIELNLVPNLFLSQKKNVLKERKGK